MSGLIKEETVTETKPRLIRGNAPFLIPESNLVRKTLRSARLKDPIVYEFSKDSGLIHQYCSMREAMFISAWGLKNFSGMKDRFDEISEVMVARKGLQVVGGGRLTISTAALRSEMPMEGPDFKLVDAFPELNLEQHTYGEFSRLAILPEFRAGSIFPEMSKRFIRKAVSEGLDYTFNMAPLPLARSYRLSMQMLGLNWKICSNVVVPDRESFEGIKMVVSVMDLRTLHKNSDKQTFDVLNTTGVV